MTLFFVDSNFVGVVCCKVWPTSVTLPVRGNPDVVIPANTIVYLISLPGHFGPWLNNDPAVGGLEVDLGVPMTIEEVFSKPHIKDNIKTFYDNFVPSCYLEETPDLVEQLILKYYAKNEIQATTQCVLNMLKDDSDDDLPFGVAIQTKPKKKRKLKDSSQELSKRLKERVEESKRVEEERLREEAELAQSQQALHQMLNSREEVRVPKQRKSQNQEKLSELSGMMERRFDELRDLHFAEIQMIREGSVPPQKSSMSLQHVLTYMTPFFTP